MPYVSEVARRHLAPYLDDLIQLLEHKNTVQTPGELTYLLYRIMLAYLTGINIQTGGQSYGTLSEVLACVESAKLEFYRRKIAPYEDLKIGQNGDL